MAVKKKTPPIVPIPERKVRIPSAQEIAAAAYRARWVPYAGVVIGVIGIGLTIWLARRPIETASLLPWKAKVEQAVGRRA